MGDLVETILGRDRAELDRLEQDVITRIAGHRTDSLVNRDKTLGQPSPVTDARKIESTQETAAGRRRAAIMALIAKSAQEEAVDERRSAG
jgi:hypothetical protein